MKWNKEWGNVKTNCLGLKGLSKELDFQKVHHWVRKHEWGERGRNTLKLGPDLIVFPEATFKGKISKLYRLLENLGEDDIVNILTW